MAASVAAVDACHKAPPPPPPAPAFNADSAKRVADSIAAANAAKARAQREADSAAAAARARADSIAAAQRRAAEAAAAARAAAEAAAKETAELRTVLTTMVHFDFDKADLRDDAKADLDAKLPILRSNPAVTLRIAGNTDDRGSEEYNLALGQRRAVSAKQYLVDRGIAATRIETISYGLERKLCQEKTEACWAQNRRDEFEITAGGDNIKKP
ncbi:MAG TPA: OmpA family protein [Gemmatimonadaceae bacterium]|nr:OmpA family protein [Gemmatimonadaceae bacterium]